MLAVIASIQKLDKSAEVLFVCSGKESELKLLRSAGIKYKVVPSGKYRRYGRGLWSELTDLKTQYQNVRDIGRVLMGVNYSKRIIKEFKPDVVFVKGGYVGLPVGIAANSLKVPIVLHESDIVMGKTNQRLSKNAKFVAVSFPESAYEGVTRDKLKFTGNPVRPEFYPASDSPAKAINKQKPNIMVFAGSQGAESINQNIFENAEIFSKQFHLLHITGEQGIEMARVVRHRLPKELQKFYEPVDFLTNDMVAAFKWSDIVVGRAGMNSLCEIAALSKPAIIIPLPSSTNDHQHKNANYLAKQGAVRVFDQSELNGLGLVNAISKLFQDKEAMNYLSETVHKFFKPSAALDIARLIIEAGERG